MRKKKTIINLILSDSKISEKIDTLNNHYAEFKTYTDFEEVLYKADLDVGEKKTEAFLKIVDYIYRIILIEYRKDNVYLSPSILTSIIYSEWKNHPDQVIKNVVNQIYLYGLHKNSYIVFPLVRFGIAKSGVKLFFQRSMTISLKTSDAVFFPQSNSKEQTIKNIESYIHSFESKKPNIIRKTIDHYDRSRPLEWFSKNPIVILKIKSTFGESNYENEYIITKILEREIAKLILLKLSQNQDGISDKNFDISTLGVNNFSTKDIKHYLYLSIFRGKLKPLAIPIHEGRGLISEILSTRLDIFPEMVTEKNKLKEMWKFIDSTFNNFLVNKHNVENINFQRRIISSMDFLRRSISSRIGVDKWIYFGSSLELLLSEGVKSGNTETIAMNGTFVVRQKQEEVYKALIKIYGNRSQAVHDGQESDDAIEAFYKYYIKIFYGITRLYSEGKINPALKRPLNEYIKKKITNGTLTTWEKNKLANKIS